MSHFSRYGSVCYPTDTGLSKTDCCNSYWFVQPSPSTENSDGVEQSARFIYFVWSKTWMRINSIALYRLVFLFFVWLFIKKFFSVLLKSGFKEFVPWILKLKYLNASSFQTFYLLWNDFINNQSIIRWTVSPKALRQSKIAQRNSRNFSRGRRCRPIKEMVFDRKCLRQVRTKVRN